MTLTIIMTMVITMTMTMTIDYECDYDYRGVATPFSSVRTKRYLAQKTRTPRGPGGIPCPHPENF